MLCCSTLTDDVMPPYLRFLGFSAIAASVITVLVARFGPQEGLETLGTGLLAYFTLLYHIPVGLAFILYGFTGRPKGLGYWAMIIYVLIVWGSGLYTWIIVSELDEAARNQVEATVEPQNFQIRDLGRTIYLQYATQGRVDMNDRSLWHQLAREADDINRRDRTRAAPIYYAAYIGDLEMVNLLLDAGARLDDKSLYPRTPLAAAVSEGHHEVAGRLLDQGASPDEGENRDKPALTVATRSGDAEMVQLLLSAGADTEAGLPPAFSIAVREGHVRIASLLLDAGAKPRMHWLNKHPIEVALENDDTAMVELLMSRTDGLNTSTDSRDPLLFLAVSSCDLESFSRYLDMGASPDVRNHKDRSVLHHITQLRTHQCDFDEVRAAFLQQLIDAGADLSVTDSRGATTTLLSLRDGRLDITRLLVEHGAPISGDLGKNNFLILAAEKGAPDLVEAALQAGFDPDASNGERRFSQPLYEAVWGGHPEIADLLIKAGAKLPNEKWDKHGLFKTAAQKNIEVLKVLLDTYVTLPTTERSDKEVMLGIRSSQQEDAITLMKNYSLDYEQSQP